MIITMLLSAALLILAPQGRPPLHVPILPKIAWFAPNYEPTANMFGGMGYYLNQGFFSRIEIESNGRGLSATPTKEILKALADVGEDPAPPAKGYPEEKARAVGKALGVRYVAFVSVKKIVQSTPEALLLTGTLNVLDMNGGTLLTSVEIATMPLVDPLKPKGMLPPLKDKSPNSPAELGAHLARNAAARVAAAKPKP